MDNVSFSFGFEDHMSSGLKSITQALASTIDFMEKVNEQIKVIDTESFDGLKKNVSKACSSIDFVGQGFEEAAEKAKELNKANFSSISKTAEKASQSISDIGAQAVGSAADLEKINSSNLNDIASGAQSAAGAVTQLGEKASGVTKSFDSMESEVTDVFSNIRKLDNSTFSGISNSAGQASQSIDEIGNEALGVSRSFDALDGELKDVLGDITKLEGTSLSGLGGEAKKAGTKLEKIGDSAKQAIPDIEKIGDVDLGNENAESLKETLESLGGAIDLSNFLNLSEIVGNMTEKMGEFASAAIDAAEEVGNINNKFEIGLDMPETDLGALRDETFQAFLNNYGESYEDLADKAIYAQQLMGNKVPIADMSDFLAQTNTLEQFNMDYEESVRGLNGLSQAFGGTWEHNTDLLTVAMNKGMNYSEELGDNLAEYAPLFKNSGFSGEEFLALGEIGIDSGAYNLDKVYDFLKEFNITLTDGSMEENIASFGDATEDAFWRFEDGSASAKEVFDAMISDLNAMPDFARSSLLSEVFSSLGEDNAADVILAMKDYEKVAQETFGNISGSAQAAADANGTAAGQLKRWWEAMPMFLAPIGEGIASAIVTPIQSIGNLSSIVSDLWNGTITFPDLTAQGLESINEFVNGFVAGLPQMVTQGWQAITSFLTGIAQKLPEMAMGALDMIIGLAQGIAQNLPTLIQKAGETLQAFTQGLRENLPTIVSAGIQMIGNLISGFLQRLPDIISTGLQLISGLAVGIANAFPSIIQSAVNIIGALVSTIWNNLPTVINTGWEILKSLTAGLLKGAAAFVYEGFSLILKFGVSAISAIPQVASSLFSAAGDLITGFVGGLAAVWSTVGNWITNSFNWIIDKVKSIFGIASPSTIFADIGNNLIQGFWNGVKAIWKNVSNWFNNTFKGLVDTVKGWVSDIFGWGKDSEDPMPEIDYSGTVATVSRQVDELKAKVETTFAQIKAQAQKIAEMCSAVIASFDLMVKTSLAKLVNLSQTAANTVSGMNNALIASNQLLYNTYTGKWEETRAVTVATVNRMAKTVTDRIIQLEKDLHTIMDRLPGYYSQIGQQMMTSMAQGIEFRKVDVTSTAGSLVQQLKDTFEKGLGIHSPSDYMIWVGQMMLAGLIEGMSASQLQKFIDGIIEDMATSFGNGTFKASEAVDFLSEQGTLDLIAKVTGMDLSNVPQNMSIPGIIQAAQQQIGYISPGGNYNSKYGLQYGNADAWCVSFVRAMAELAGVPFPATGYVPDVVSWARSNGRWTQTPQAGYAVIFDWTGSGSGSHIGLVESVQGPGRITTIEGNTSGPQGTGVYRKNRSSNIMGYVALDGGHGVGGSLQMELQNAYNMKYHPERLLATSSNTGNIAYDLGAGVTQWTSLVAKALQMTGQSQSWLPEILATMQKESSGNPNAINLTDTNATVRHTPSKGLMQVIDPTFRQYAMPGYDTNIWDPLSNILASIRYQIARYGGDLSAKLHGYAVGTRYVPQDMLAILHEGEAVIPAGQNPYSQSGGDYLGDMINNAYLDPRPIVTPEGSSSTNNNVSVSMNITQNITDETDARGVANESINILRDELDRYLQSTGGGVSLEY